MRDPRYDPLFEPIAIGPVTAPNRFYQVPHCSGMGYQRPQMMAAMRGIKAEGGWGVVCTFIDFNMMQSQSEDTIENFQEVYSFEEAFDDPFRLDKPGESTEPKN